MNVWVELSDHILLHPPLHDLFENMGELERVMADVVLVIDDIALEDFIRLRLKESSFFDFERFFIFFCLILRDDFFADMTVIYDHVVEFSRVDVVLDRIDEINNFHIGRLATLRHRVTDIDDLGLGFIKGFTHPSGEEVRDDTRIEISRSNDDIVSIQDSLSCSRIEGSGIAFEPCLDDILVDIMRSSSGIFIRYVDIFFSDDHCTVFKFYC